MSSKQKIIPPLRFPEFENDGEWEVKKLENICDVNPTNEELPEEFVYVDLESVEKGRLLKRSLINLKDAPSRAQRLLKKDDVIYQIVRPYQKNNFFFDIDDEFEYVASTGYALLRAFKSKKFLYQYLHTTNFVNRVLAKCTGSNYPAINSKDLSRIKVIVPQNLAEQQKIANCLSSLDALITAETEKRDLLQDHKKGLLQQLFPAAGDTQPKYRFPEFVNDGEWEEKEIGKLFKFKQGVQVSIDSQFPNKENGLVRFIRIIDITGNSEPPRYIKNPGNDHIITRNDLFMVRYGSPGLISIGFNGVIANNLFRLIWKSKGVFNSHFWYYSFQRLEKKVFNLSGSSSMPAISFSTLNILNAFYPTNPKEQQKIANCLSAADELIAAQTQKIKALKKHKKGLMQQLFPNHNP